MDTVEDTYFSYLSVSIDRDQIMRYRILCFAPQFEGVKYEAEGPYRYEAEQAVLQEVFDHKVLLGRRETYRANKKILINALISRAQPTLDRIKFVLECMRASTAHFEETDDILSKKERDLLLRVDRSIYIESYDGKYKATVRVNDTEIVQEGSSVIQTRNDTCLAAFEVLYKAMTTEDYIKDVDIVSNSTNQEPDEVSEEESSEDRHSSDEVMKKELAKVTVIDKESYREQIIRMFASIVIETLMKDCCLFQISSENGRKLNP